MVFLFQPISCVFYPMDVLPAWLKAIAWINPAAHIFEGMRTVLTTHAVPATNLAFASGLNLLYLAAVVGWFHYTYNVCKERGSLVRVGE
jgi:ABC-2 type transport system permease protein